MNLLRYRNNLIYGPSGAGKTHLLGTAMQDERTAPILVLDFEGGSITLEGSGATVLAVRDWDDYSEVYNTLANNNNTVDGVQYKSLAIDSVSETHLYSLMNAVDDRVKLLVAKNETGNRVDPNKTEIQDYGTALIQMRRFLRSFRDLPMHTFVTSLTKTEVLPREGSTRLPSCFGQLAEELCGMYDCVGYLAQLEEPKSTELKRVLLLQNQKGVRVKVRTRWGVVAPEKIVDPTITALLNAFKEPMPETSK
jgi:hypothetical protein